MIVNLKQYLKNNCCKVLITLLYFFHVRLSTHLYECIFNFLTDRGNDNWLIKYTQPDIQENEDPEADWSVIEDPSIEIAAIDNGLAFPFKHPDQWRTCLFWLK